MTATYDVLIPPFNFRVQTDIALVEQNLHTLYGQQVLPEGSLPFIDYYIAVRHSTGLRRWFRPQASFFCDQHEPLKPLHLSQAFAMLEWGMNWTIAAHELQHVIVHSGILAKHNQAILFPAPPGSGKSTMSAYLAFNGWRLLSDEMAVIDPETFEAIPFARPICLKNKSIDLARSWFPDAPFSTVAKDTHKGDVIHLSAPLNEDDRFAPARIKGIVFPKYNPDITDIQITQLNQSQAMHELADNAFNFSLMAHRGFKALTHVVEQADSYHIEYRDTADVKAFLEQEVLEYV